MKVDLGFPKIVFLTVGIVFAIAVYPLLVYGTPEIFSSVIVGCVISVLNVLLGYIAVEYAFDKSNKIFLKVVLGGIGARLIATAVVVLLLISYYNYHIPSLIISLFGFYFLFLFYEVLFYNKKLSFRKGA